MKRRSPAFILLTLGLSLSLSTAGQGESSEAPGSATPQFVIPRLVGSTEVPPRDVLSLREIRQYRAALAPRLLADHLDFPLMVKPSEPLIRAKLGAPSCAYFGNDFKVTLCRPWCEREAWPVFDCLKGELQRQGVDASKTESEVEIPLMVFLANADALRGLVGLCGDAPEAGRRFVRERLGELEEVGLWLLRFKQASLNGLRTLEEMDRVALPAETDSATRPFEPLVAASEGMTEEDTRALLDVLDAEEFQQLSLLRTAELLGGNLSREETRQRLSEMSPSEAITAAAYFARSRLQAYASPEMQMESLLEAGPAAETVESWLQVGDCKHFAGLTVHYLNHVVKPLNPRLAHWYFGVQVTHLQDYHHAYVKAVHVGPDGDSLDLFFFDPTVLANYPLRRLHPDKVRKLIEATERNDHYFVLKRYAEDLVRSPHDPDLAFDELEINLPGDDGRIDLLPLLRR